MATSGSTPAKKKWKELSPMARFGTIAAAIVQLSLLVAAQTDITPTPGCSRSAAARRMWRLATLVNFIGPASVFHLRREAPARREMSLLRPPVRNLLAGSLRVGVKCGAFSLSL